jgi:hypothetical protein
VSQGARPCFTSQILGEFWNASTRPLDKNGLGLSVDETDRIARVIERDLELLPDSRDVHDRWRQLLFAHKVKGVQAQRVRRAPPRVSGTVLRRTEFTRTGFCASSSKVHDTRLAASMYPRRHAITDRQRPGLSTVPAAPHRPSGRSGPLDVTAMSTNLALTLFEIGPDAAVARRFLEFFTVNIRNKNTRAPYARAAAAQRGARFSTRLPPNSFGGDARTLWAVAGKGGRNLTLCVAIR